MDELPDYYECVDCENVARKAQLALFGNHSGTCRHCGGRMRAMSPKEFLDMVEQEQTKDQFNKIESIANGY